MSRHVIRGFTLIELLVVIAIIVALLAILLPSLNGAVTHAQRAVCMSNIHQQHQSQLNYIADFHGMFWYRDAISPDYHRWANNVHSPVSVMRDNYMPQLDIMLCPLLADLPNQTYGQYQRHDWLTPSNYGGWATNAHNVYNGYMWLASFRPINPVYYNNTRPFPARASDLNATQALITHRLSFHTPSNSHEIVHGGRGLNVTGVAAFDDYQMTEMPIGFGDGSGNFHRGDEVQKRVYSISGGAGTYLW